MDSHTSIPFETIHQMALRCERRAADPRLPDYAAARERHQAAGYRAAMALALEENIRHLQEEPKTEPTPPTRPPVEPLAWGLLIAGVVMLAIIIGLTNGWF